MLFERKTVTDLFTHSNRYKVPSYQRGYAWKKNRELGDFWADVTNASIEEPLYLGALIVQKTKDESGDYWQIVDGQQRITTICLALLVCRNIAIKNNWPQATTLPSLLGSQNIPLGQTAGLRVEVGQNINPAYEFIVQHPEWDEAAFPSYIDGRRARILKNNYFYLTEQIDAFSQEEFANFLIKLLDATFFLRIEVDEDLQAFDIFERTNARGAPLNIGDLLKNRLFANAENIPRLQERWDKIVTESDTKLPRVLKYFDSLSHGQDTGRAVLFPHLRDSLNKSESPSSFMDNIEMFAKFFNSVDKHSFTRDPSHRISNAANFEFLYGEEIFFNRVKRSLDALSLFGIYVALPAIYSGMLALQRFYEPGNEAYAKLKKDFLKTLNLIECFHFINNQICTRPTNKVEPIYAKASEAIGKTRTIAECKTKLKDLQESLKKSGLEDKSVFVSSFLREMVYTTSENKADFAYAFDRLNQGPFVSTPNLSIYEPHQEAIMNRVYEVEHIAPISTWNGEEDSLNSIGNLLVLTKETNQIVGSLGLKEKIEIYKERNFDNQAPVKDFVKWVEEEGVTEMSEEAIEKRARKIAVKAYDEVWNPWQ